MSNIGDLIAEQEQRSEDFKARMAAEREELSEMSDAAVRETVQSPEAYLHYLDVQADNPAFSVSNVMLAIKQRPDATLFKSLKGWNENGRKVRSGETGMKVRVSETYVKDGKSRRGYKVGRVFDIKQTTGKDKPRRTVLTDGTEQIRAALRALLKKSPVKAESVPDSPYDAFYDPQRLTVFVSESLTDSRTFAVLAREIFRAKLHDRGAFAGYDREQTELDAASVSYMLCRCFGVPCEKPDTADLVQNYEGIEPQDARGNLETMQRIFRELQVAVRVELTPQSNGEGVRT